MEGRTNHKINRMDQHSQKPIPSKAGEIEAFRVLDIGEAKWWKEHIPRKGNNLNDITEEGMSLLDDTKLWWEKQNLLWACHVSRSKDRVNNDGSFVTHQIGAISSTSQVTGTYARVRVETRWGSGWKRQQSDLRTSGGCSKQIHTVSHRTIGEIKSPRARSLTSATSEELYGYPKGDSTRKTISLFSP